MKTLMNLSTSPEDLGRFLDGDDLRAFYRTYGLDGVELFPMDDSAEAGLVPPDSIIGAHLSFPPCWVDFYRGDEGALVRNFGSMEVAEAMYGGRNPDVLVQRLRAQLNIAQKWRVEYVVFHVSDVSPNESISYVFRHTDEAVVQAAAELINRACENRTDGFDFLVENLWWPGLTMTRPEITRALLEEIHLPRAGIMLDVGHFLNTDRSLKSLSEGMCAIRRMLDAHGKLCGRIKGVHLHGGISGAYVEGMLAQRIALTGDYGTRMGACYRHILHIDRHTPFDCAGISELIREIAPRYLTYELITRDRREHAQYLQRQKRGCDTKEVSCRSRLF